MLPENLKSYVKNGKTYYRYTFPDGRRKGLGGDPVKAVRLALSLNQKLAAIREDEQLRKLLINKDIDHSLDRVVRKFSREWLQSSDRFYAASSLKGRLERLEHYTRHWQDKPIGSITTYDISQFLGQYSQESARQHRILLKQLFSFAVEEGLCEGNPVLITNPRRQPKAKRKRHTWEGYCAILDAAPPWLNRAMRLAFYSLQRRGDLVHLQRNQINLADRTIRVRQRKTGIDLLIVMGDDLYGVVKESMNTGILCPYLIHTRPKRLTMRVRQAKPHPFAVTEAYLSRAFKDVRDTLGVYNHLPVVERPGFHSIRALGTFALQKAKFPVEYIQALAGHADEDMTLHYLEGHEAPEPQRVEAGLSLGKVNWDTVNWEASTSHFWQPPES